MRIRLADFIRAEMEPILLDWDDFTVTLVGAKQRMDVERAAQKNIDALATPFQIEQELVWISVSIGITLYPHDTPDKRDG